MSGRVEKPDTGISLIEVVVAVLVLSIGVIAGFQSLGAARQGIGSEIPRLLAHQVALNRVAEMQMFGAAATFAPEVTMGRIVWQVETETQQTTSGVVEVSVKAFARDHPGGIYTAYVPAAVSP